MRRLTTLLAVLLACSDGGPGDSADGDGTSGSAAEGSEGADPANGSADAGTADPSTSGSDDDDSGGSGDSTGSMNGGWADCPDDVRPCVLCDATFAAEEFTSQEPRDIAVRADGSAYLTGTRFTVSGGAEAIVLAWPTECGELSWVYRDERPDETYPGPITLHDDEVVFLSTNATTHVQGLQRLTESGDPVWPDPRPLELVGARIADLAADSAGTLAAVGARAGASPGDSRLWRGQLDLEGTLLWDSVDGPDVGAAVLTAIALDADDRWYEAGYNMLDPMAGEIHLWVARRVAGADPDWVAPPDAAAGFAVAVDPAGNVAVGGGVLDGMEQGMWVRKYGPGGNELWTDIDSDYEMLAGVAIDSQGSVIVAPQYHRDHAFDGDFWVRKYDADGHELWTHMREIDNPDGLVSSWIGGLAVDGEDRIHVSGVAGPAGGGLDLVWHVLAP